MARSLSERSAVPTRARHPEVVNERSYMDHNAPPNEKSTRCASHLFGWFRSHDLSARLDPLWYSCRMTSNVVHAPETSIPVHEPVPGWGRLPLGMSFGGDASGV